MKYNPTPFDFADTVPDNVPDRFVPEGEDPAYSAQFCDCCGNIWGLDGYGAGSNIKIFGKKVCGNCLKNIIFSADWSDRWTEEPFFFLDEAKRGALKTQQPRYYRYVSPKMRAKLLKDGECKFCGTKERLTIDHIHPVSKGGTSHESNLQVLCSSCNSGKRDKVL